MPLEIPSSNHAYHPRFHGYRSKVFDVRCVCGWLHTFDFDDVGGVEKLCRCGAHVYITYENSWYTPRVDVPEGYAWDGVTRPEITNKPNRDAGKTEPVKHKKTMRRLGRGQNYHGH